MKYATLLLGAIIAIMLAATFTPARAGEGFAFLKDLPYCDFVDGKPKCLPLGSFPVSLPPLKYDRPFKGQLIIIRVDSEAQLIQNCNAKFEYGYALGCAFPNTPVGCVVYLRQVADIIAMKQDPARVLRHELGHCNGWGPDHAGWR